MTRTAQWRGRLAAAVLLASSVTGCDDGDTSNLPPPPETAASGGSQATVDPAHQPILDAYRGSVRAMVAAQATGDPEHPDLARYFLERTQAFENVRNGVLRQEARGTRYEGELLVVTAEVTELDQTAEPPEATIASCLDDSGYRLVDREDGSPVPDSEPGGRYRVTSEAVLGNDDQWYVVESTAHWDEEC